MQKIKEGAMVLIRSRQSGMLLGIEGDCQENGALLRLVNGQKEAQSWRLERAEGEFFRLCCGTSGKVIDIVDGGTQDGSWLHLWEKAEVESQLWSIVPTEEGCKILAKQGNKCLDVVGLCQEEGAHLQIWEDLNGENQKWVLELQEEPCGQQPEKVQPQESCPEAVAEQPRTKAEQKATKAETATAQKSTKAAKSKGGAKRASKKK